MVKELTDDGNKGALRISITRLQHKQAPACTRFHRRGEIVISDGWDYYWGVKGGLVILIGADGLNDGINFDVFDSKSGRKIFKDIVLLLEPKEELNFARDLNGQLSLMYQRLFAGDCSVPQGGASCWAKFQKVPGLKDAPMPKCSGYEQLDPRYRDDPSVISYHRDDPSVISYPVEVNLFPRPTTKVLSSSVKCRAAE
jgi:hypothetical protein